MTGTDDPLLEVERALREAEGVAQRMYEAVDVAADREAALEAAEAAAEVEDRLRETLAEAPATTIAGAGAKLRLAASELQVAGYGGPAAAAVRTALDFLTGEQPT